MKLKLIVAALALSSFASVASAAVSHNYSASAVSGNSSFLFSAWNDNGSYTYDLGTLLNTVVGADTVAGVGGSSGNATKNGNNTLPSATLTATGSYDIKLDGFSATSYASIGSSWNLVAADALVRNRAVVSQSVGSTFDGSTINNGMVSNVASSFDNYRSLLSNADSYVVGGNPVVGAVVTTSVSDAWYANGTTWSSTLGDSGITGTAVAYGSAASLYIASQNSSDGDLADQSAVFSNLNYTAFTHLVGSDVYLTIQSSVAAVPEADTSGMMLAGLGLMGFIARRRNGKQA